MGGFIDNDLVKRTCLPGLASLEDRSEHKELGKDSFHQKTLFEEAHAANLIRLNINRSGRSFINERSERQIDQPDYMYSTC